MAKSLLLYAAVKACNLGSVLTGFDTKDRFSMEVFGAKQEAETVLTGEQPNVGCCSGSMAVPLEHTLARVGKLK